MSSCITSKQTPKFGNFGKAAGGVFCSPCGCCEAWHAASTAVAIRLERWCGVSVVSKLIGQKNEAY